MEHKDNYTNGGTLLNVLACVRPKKDDGACTRGWEDLQIYIRLFGSEETAIVSDALVQTLDIDKDSLFEQAISNLRGQVRVRAIGDVLSEATGEDCFDEVPILVASTTSGLYGAGVMLILKETFKNKWVIPCSVHEVLLIDKGSFDRAAVDKMICDVNASMLDEDEVLSDHAYDLDNLSDVAGGEQDG